MNIIQVYAPRSEKPDYMLMDFYASFNQAKKLQEKGKITAILRDFNVKVETGTDDDILEKYGLAKGNTTGDRLVQFCCEQKLCIINTITTTNILTNIST